MYASRKALLVQLAEVLVMDVDHGALPERRQGLVGRLGGVDPDAGLRRVGHQPRPQEQLIATGPTPEPGPPSSGSPPPPSPAAPSARNCAASRRRRPDPRTIFQPTKAEAMAVQQR